MEIEITNEQPTYNPQDHPWLEMTDDSVDETLRFSLDEIRIG